MQRTPMTREGHARLEKELDQLKRVERPAIIKAIAEARAHGDLKENAEYHAAREQQGFIEGRIKELEAALSFAEVIDISKLNAGSRVVFGATVVVEEIPGKKPARGAKPVQITWQIVGEDEADIKKGRISVSSPIARALIGKESGERVDVNTPGGIKRYEIVDVRYE